jgi:glyoxylase-like metal-dependent hydrolase (beta-lactamase superfamily II)
MVKTFTNDFTENTYLIIEKKKTIIIDPGAKFEEIKAYVDDNELQVQFILLTHGHFDHIYSLNECIEGFQCDVYINELERDFLFDPNLNLSATSYKKIKVTDKQKVKTFTEKDTFELPYNTITIKHTPGHTRGSSVFLYKHFLFSGDTIFNNAVGRTDLPTGNQNDLERSINDLLHYYKDNTLIYPGHGTYTTVATMKTNCMYYRD